MNEEDKMIQAIRDKTNETEIPESLSADHMMQKVKAETKRRSRIKRYKSITAVAACISIFLVGLGVSEILVNQGSDIVGEPGEVVVDKTQTYDDIYRWVKKVNDNYKKQNRSYSKSADIVEETSSSALGQNDNSDTNVQVEGVDEADIVKTDNRYIYLLDGICVRIIDTEHTMREVNKIEIYQDIQEEQEITVHDMYVNQDKLHIIYTIWNWEDDSSVIVVITYDITDRNNVKESGRVTQTGEYHTSRRIDDILYVFSNYYVYDSDKESCVPIINNKKIAARDVLLMGGCKYPQYTTIISIDTESPSKILDSQAILAGYGEIYVSKQNMYIGVNRDEEVKENKNFKTYQSVTDIIRVEYINGQIEYKGIVTIDGLIHNSFSMDEYNGYLRVVTTSNVNMQSKNAYILEDSIASNENNQSNNLYIINAEMKVVGSIEGLAENESIQSARFMGDIGYFVTFRQVDPLFSVDLSDPENPKIMGELKITGFSSYLHFWSENLLLGIGREADPVTGITTGVKLSMFDISDPTDVKEINKKVLKGDNYVEALDNHKAVLIDPEKNIVGFSIESYYDINEYKHYYLFSYDEQNGFQEDLKHIFNVPYNVYYDWTYARGVYIGNYLYVLCQNIGISQYTLDGYKLINTLDF